MILVVPDRYLQKTPTYFAPRVIYIVGEDEKHVLLECSKISNYKKTVIFNKLNKTEDSFLNFDIIAENEKI